MSDLKTQRIIDRYLKKSAANVDPAMRDLRGTAKALIDVVTYIYDNIEYMEDDDLAAQLGHLRYDLKDEIVEDIDKFLKAVGLERFVLEEQ